MKIKIQILLENLNKYPESPFVIEYICIFALVGDFHRESFPFKQLVTDGQTKMILSAFSKLSSRPRSNFFPA